MEELKELTVGFREIRTYWPSSLAGLVCGPVTMAGVVVAVSTERNGLGALLVITGFVLFLIVLIIAIKLRKPGQPF